MQGSKLISREGKSPLLTAIPPLLPPLLIIAFVLLRYHSITAQFWMIDDPQILKFAITRNPLEYFFYPEEWRRLSAGNFTPMLPLSFLIDWKLFGLSTQGFYLHHLTGLCLAALAAYAFLRLWLPAITSFAGVVLFIASPTFAEASKLLMVRHYTEGFIFALMAAYCYVQAVRKDRTSMKIAGAFFYLLAILSKEIYLMFVCLVIILPEGNWRKRFSFAFLWICTAAGYVLWRHFMLGRLSGGYGLELSLPHDLLVFIPNVISAMGGDLGSLSSLWLWFTGASTLLAVGILLQADRKAAFFVISISVFVLLPVIPVATAMSPRFVFLPAFALIAAHLFAWNVLTISGRFKYTLPAVLLWTSAMLCCFLYVSLLHPFMTEETVWRHATEGRFVMYEGNSSDLLIEPAAISQGHYYGGLSWLRKEILHLEDGPEVNGDINIICSDKPFLENANIRERFIKIWRYDPAKGSLVNEDINLFCGKENRDSLITVAPLHLTFAYQDSLIRWELGPYENGSYTVLFGETANDVIALPMKGKRYIFLKNQTSVLRLRYVAPEGWITYSPLLRLTVDESDTGYLEWRR